LEDYELAILGQGSAAFAAAFKANELGVRTAVVGSNVTEGAVIGGTCVNVGCMPSKRLITVGTTFHNGKKNPFDGIEFGKGGKLNFRRVIQEKDRMVRKFRKEKYADVLKSLKRVTYFPTHGSFASKNEIRAGDQTLLAEKTLVATGARANVPPVEGIEKVDYLTNEEALSLKELPDSLCVIGGRALGLEFAQMYAHFGTKVTLLQRSERILPEDEPEVSSALTQYLRGIGVRIYTSAVVKQISKKGREDKAIRFSVKGVSKEAVCEHVLFATGRRPNTEHLHLEKAGVKTDEKGFVVVNDEMQTSVPNVWAAGDVTGEPMLETIAAKEGAVAVHNAFNDKDAKKISFDEVPSAVFTYPEIGRVGLTKAEAERRGIKCGCSVLSMELVPKAHVIKDTRGLVKMVINDKTKQVLGVHILAPHAADLIHEGVLAVKNKLTIDDIIDTVHVFPTLSESIKLAAQSFYVDIGKMSCCIE
jgi:mercuric reductase